MQQTIEKRLRVVFYVLLFGLIFSLLAIKFAPAQKIASTNLTGPAGSVIGRNFPTNWLYVPVDSSGYLLVSGIGGGGGGGSTNPYADLYPASCGVAGAPAYCSGTTPDAWIRSACAALPSTGGFISLRGLTGNIVNSVTCSTPTKLVIMYADNTSRLNITESDGGTVFPLDNGSMFIGEGAGQCTGDTGGSGIRLSSGANVAGIVGPAHTDGTQENFTASGLCVYGAAGATVSQGLLYSENNFANTTFENNNAFLCNTACLKITNGSDIFVLNNWLNVAAGSTSGLTGTPLIIQGSGLGPGCNVGPVTVVAGQFEHALGGGPEISILGDGAGAQACNITIRDLGIERNPTGTASTIGVKVEDCLGCKIDSVIASGVSSGGADLINVSQSAANRTLNVSVLAISNVYGTYTNTLNDATPGGTTLTGSSWPQISTYYAHAGYVDPGAAITGIGGDLTVVGPGSVTGTVIGLNGVLLSGLSNGLFCFTAGVPSACINVSVPGLLRTAVASQSGNNIQNPCAGTVNFDLSLGDYQTCVLTGNVTSSTITNAPATISGYGQTAHFTICQDTTGGRTFVWPTALAGVSPITLTASTTTSPYNSCTTESFTLASGVFQSDAFNSANCISAASPAVCGQAVQGDIAIPVGTNPTLVVNTSGYTATSQFIFTPDATLGTALSVTCNTANLPTGYSVTAATPGVSVTITLTGTFSTNPVCGKFTIRNL